MAERDNVKKDEDEVKKFLEAEYQRYWNFLQYQYDVRDKYVQYFLIALGALGGLLGTVLKDTGINNRANLTVAAIIVSVLLLLSLFTFAKVLYERKMTTESRRRLNGLRREILARMGVGTRKGVKKEKDDFGKSLLPRRMSANRYYGGDNSVRFFISGITALSVATFSSLIVSVVSYCVWLVFVLAALLVLPVTFLFLWSVWEFYCWKWTCEWYGRPERASFERWLARSWIDAKRNTLRYQTTLRGTYHKLLKKTTA